MRGQVRRVTAPEVRSWKGQRKVVALTAYDYPTAAILDESGVDVILVGDSVGNVVLGLPDTLGVSMDDMLRHTAAVRRGVERALVVADMPFMSYQVSPEEALRNAGRLVGEAGAHAVKLEGGVAIAEAVRRIVAAGIPVMGHIGLTPQAVHGLGGYRIQGKSDEDRNRLLDEALLLEQFGVFSIVLECIEPAFAARLTRAVHVPTIGIGSGRDTDGQILVTHDLLGFTVRPVPRFVRPRADLRKVITTAVTAFARDVRD